MTGPDHYRAAEKILADVFVWPDDGPDVAAAIAVAQVHATLAQAAATALAADPTPDALELWDEFLLPELVFEDDVDEDAAAVVAYDRAVEADTGQRVSLGQALT